VSLSSQKLNTAIQNHPPAEKQIQTIGSEMQVGISSFSSWMFGVGSVIGSMVWLFNGPMIARAGTLASVFAWILAAVCMLPMSLIVMELASMFPAAGGPYVYKYYAFKRLLPRLGELVGFLTGWLFWIAMIVGMACMSNGLVNMLSTSIWGGATACPIWFGPLIIAGLFALTTVCNFRSIAQAAHINNVFTLMKFAMAASFIVLALCSPDLSMSRVLLTASPGGSTNFFKNIISVFMLALTGFGGIELTGCVSSETSDARKSVPRAVFMTLIAVALIYASVCIATSVAAPYVLSADKTTVVIPNTNIVATCPSLAGYIGGPICGIIFTSCVVASIVGCGFVFLLSNARLGYSMAKTGLFPLKFAQLDEQTKVPKYSLIFQFWCCCIIGIAANLLSRTGILPDAYTFLAETFGFMYGFIALLYGFCAVSLRYTDPDLPRPFRVGHKGNALIWLLASATVLTWGYAAFGCISLYNQIAGFIIMMSGIPIYAFYRWQR
jgi:amino acid transporter